jgi:lipopolysaccharide transport system permease protein/teichoic acid transport system permease protein
MLFFLKEAVYFVREVYRRKFQLFELTKRDFRQRYIGSFLGLFWAFLEPLALILIMCFVFSFGFRSGGSDGVPFVIYLFTGMIAFNFFNDTISASSGVIRSYSFLIRKVNFSVSILPIVKIISALILHLIFILIVILILWIYGFRPKIYWLQIFYYLAASLYFITALSWLLSALGVFIKDISHIVSIFLRFAFWLTPIFWKLEMLPEKYVNIIILNPVYYIVQGYRDSLIYGVPFWKNYVLGMYFWGLSTVFMIAGVIVFKRLMPHFADVL